MCQFFERGVSSALVFGSESFFLGSAPELAGPLKWCGGHATVAAFALSPIKMGCNSEKRAVMRDMYRYRSATSRLERVRNSFQVSGSASVFSVLCRGREREGEREKGTKRERDNEKERENGE